MVLLFFILAVPSVDLDCIRVRAHIFILILPSAFGFRGRPLIKIYNVIGFELYVCAFVHPNPTY